MIQDFINRLVANESGAWDALRLLFEETVRPTLRRYLGTAARNAQTVDDAMQDFCHHLLKDHKELPENNFYKLTLA